jgi:hypothetical protein
MIAGSEEGVSHIAAFCIFQRERGVFEHDIVELISIAPLSWCFYPEKLVQDPIRDRT